MDVTRRIWDILATMYHGSADTLHTTTTVCRLAGIAAVSWAFGLNLWTGFSATRLSVVSRYFQRNTDSIIFSHPSFSKGVIGPFFSTQCIQHYYVYSTITCFDFMFTGKH